MVKISPSLFQFKSSELARAVKKISHADLIHIDVTDGTFVGQDKASLFYDPAKLKAVQANSDVPLDVHLMVEDPLTDLEKYAALSPRPEYISFHIEATTKSGQDPKAVIKKIRSYGIKPAIAVNPATSLAEIKGLLKSLDMVLLMSVVPGLPGQSYISDVNDKIIELKGMIDEKGLETLIQVDGGIKLENVNIPINAGADVIVSGTGIFSHKSYSPREVIDKMKSVIVLGSDHGGYELKEKIRAYLDNKGIAYKDMGCYDTQSVDYPNYADKVCKPILAGEYKRGMLFCGTGIGISIRANRYNGIRAALVHNEKTAKLAAEHNNANVLVMGGRTTSVQMAKKMFDAWYTTKFEERHQRRLDMLDKKC
ncbi:ribose 5-phosphate isomerase B [Candidatus Woesearchaeota archaeon]|jgi:ribulose-phosphate 3-epimerase|nr:ribose 5-phosphate isomerase B [Candidatus Woesearchaeota archaeon]